jgi:hypothetical protein
MIRGNNSSVETNVQTAAIDSKATVKSDDDSKSNVTNICEQYPDAFECNLDDFGAGDFFLM